MNVLGWLAGRIGLRPHTDETSRAVSRKGMAALGLNGSGRMYLRDHPCCANTMEIVFRTEDGVAHVYPLTALQTKKWAARLAAAAARGE